jgi:acyl-ACP thioesterase
MNNIFHNFPDNDNIFRRDFTVRYSEVNKFGILKLQSLFDYLQQIAAEHANSLGFGMHALYDKNMIWVLSKMSIKICGTFRPEQIVSAATYPSSVEKIFFRREFEISDTTSGEVLARASSFWLLLDSIKLRPLRRNILEGVRLDNPELPVFVKNFPASPAEITFTEDALITDVKFSQMDINQHLNNAQYAALTEDAIYEKLQKQFNFKEINISFLRAQKYPDKLATSINISNSGEFQLESRNIAQQNTAFSAFGTLEY